MGKGRGKPEKAAGVEDILEPETVSIIVSSLSSIFQAFVDLGTVDAASVLPRTLLSGSTKETYPASPHNVGQSRDCS
jgi:hypothetical protein